MAQKLTAYTKTDFWQSFYFHNSYLQNRGGCGSGPDIALQRRTSVYICIKIILMNGYDDFMYSTMFVLHVCEVNIYHAEYCIAFRVSFGCMLLASIF